MEQSVTTSRHIYRNVAEHPFYFGHYINMGRNNAHNILKNIALESGLTDNCEENQLENSAVLQQLRKSKSASEIRSISGRIFKQFPYMKVFESEDPAIMADVLCDLLFFTNKLRNRFSHYREPEWEWINEAGRKKLKNLSKTLNRIFNEGIRLIRQRRNYQDEYLSHLVYNKEEKEKFRYSLFNEGKTDFTETGIIYFINLFIEKKYATRLISHIKGFKDASELSKRATRDCFTIYCCELPQPKLVSEKPEMALLLDMMNELPRCPHDLYKTLGESDRNKFYRGINTGVLDEDGNPVEQEVIMKRHSDRFPFFALRWLEETKALPSLRFQINLGKLNLLKKNNKPRDKKIAGTMRERTIIKPLHGFGYLYDFIDRKNIPAFWFKNNDKIQGELIGAIEQFSPSYLISGNRIGFSYTASAAPVWPNFYEKKSNDVDGILSTYDLPHMVFLQLLFNSGEAEKGPEEILLEKTADMDNFFRDINSGKIQSLITVNPIKRGINHNSDELEELKQRQVKVEEILNNYGIRYKDIPDSIRDYLMNITHEKNFDYLKRKMDEQIVETNEKLEDCNLEIEFRKSKENKAVRNKKELKKHPGKKLNNGDMASYLASDIVDFLPLTKGKGRVNNEQYVELQSSIALFSTHKQNLKDLFIELDAHDNKTGHPFLNKIDIDKAEGVLHFYGSYLKNRLAHLKKIKENIDNLEGTRKEIAENYNRYFYFLKPPFILTDDGTTFRFKGKDAESVRNKALNIQLKPYMLPRGIFSDAIKKALNKNGINLKETDNIIHAIETYFNDEAQEFYNFKRNYKLSKDLTITDKTPLQLSALAAEYKSDAVGHDRNEKSRKDEITAGELYKRFCENVIENEKRIRFHKANDRLLLSMIRRLASQMGGFERTIDTWQLSNLDNILKEEMEFTLKYPEIDISIYDSALSFRRYGEFRRLLKDRRIKNLLTHFTEEKRISRIRIEKEIEDYENMRELVFETVYSFEKKLYSLYGSVLIKKMDQNYISHREFLDVYFSKYPLDYLHTEEIIKIRNRFYHNQFPENVFVTINTKDSNGLFGKFFGNFIIETYNQFAKNLEHVIVE